MGKIPYYRATNKSAPILPSNKTHTLNYQRNYKANKTFPPYMIFHILNHPNGQCSSMDSGQIVFLYVPRHE